MLYLPKRKVMSFMNSSATVTVFMWVANRKGLKSESNSTLIQFETNAARTQTSRSNKKITAQPDCDSAIGQHLLKNRKCAKNYKDTKFSILTFAHSQFQLRLLEATLSM